MHFKRLHDRARLFATRAPKSGKIQKSDADELLVGNVTKLDHDAQSGRHALLGTDLQELELLARARAPTRMSATKDELSSAGAAHQELPAGMVRPAGREIEVARSTAEDVTKHSIRSLRPTTQFPRPPVKVTRPDETRARRHSLVKSMSDAIQSHCRETARANASFVTCETKS
jgi:hypothetical protein